MIRTVEQFCKKQQLWQNGDRILVACSGGPDSVALLQILAELRQVYSLQLVACYIHHGIRQAADQEVEFVKALAEAFHIPFRWAFVPVPTLAAQWHQSIETVARNERYRLLEEIREEEQAQYIAVAHHQNDQAETVLHRLLRGAGLQGLRGMQPKNGHLIRPFLCVTRQEIEAYIAEKGLAYCEDETNEDVQYLRNRIRHELVPLLLTYNPNLIDGLNRLATIVGEEESYMEEETKRYLLEHKVRCEEGLSISRKALRQCHQALRRRVLRSLFAEMTGSTYNVSFGYIDRIEELLYKGAGKVFIGQGIRVWTTYDTLYFTKIYK